MEEKNENKILAAKKLQKEKKPQKLLLSCQMLVLPGSIWYKAEPLQATLPLGPRAERMDDSQQAGAKEGQAAPGSPCPTNPHSTVCICQPPTRALASPTQSAPD